MTTADHLATDEIANLGAAIRNRLQIDVDEATVRAVLTEWHEALDGLKWSSSWVGDIAVFAYHMLRSAWGHDAHGVPSAAWPTGAVPERLAVFRRDLVLHCDYLIPTKLDPDMWVLEFDINGQYLSSADIELGTGLPWHVEDPRGMAAILTHPGYVRLDRAVTVNRPGWRVLAPGSVLTTVTARWVDKLTGGNQLGVSEALIWTDHRRHLELWKTLFRNGRDYLINRNSYAATIALAMLKAVTNTLLGGWLIADKNHSDLSRPDFSDMIVSEAEVRKNIALDKVNLHPLGVRRDAAWFAVADRSTIPQGLVISTQLGKWKLARVVRADDVAEAALSGSAETFVRAMKRAALPVLPPVPDPLDWGQV